MTDEVQKIRKEVERLFNHVKDSTFESDSGAFYYFKDLLDFIDSLQEEPVSKPLVDIEIPFGSRDSELLEESIAVPEGYHAIIEGNKVVIRKGEEPVSKDLTNEIKLWFKQWSEKEEEWSREDIWDTAEHFAKWQKEKDDEEKVLIYKHGFEDCKKQMVKDAVDACVTDIRTYYKEENEIDFTVMYEKGIIPYEIEQEVKLIIIKEE